MEFKKNNLYYVPESDYREKIQHIFKYLGDPRAEDDRYVAGYSLFLYSSNLKAIGLGKTDSFAAGSAFGHLSKPLLEHPNKKAVIKQLFE